MDYSFIHLSVPTTCHRPRFATTVVTLKSTERRGNVYENKGPPWETRGRNGNVYENKGTYPLTPGMSLKKQVVSPQRKDRICFPKGIEPLCAGTQEEVHRGDTRKAPQALWSAAACCRFSPASLLAFHRSECRAPVRGQQAGLAEREKRQQAGALQSTSTPQMRVVWYTAVVLFLDPAGGCLGGFPQLQPPRSQGFCL